MKLERTGETYRRHPDGHSRAAILQGLVRGGVATGILGTSAVLATRKVKFECSSRCGKCPKFNHGMCGLGLK